MTGIEIRLEKKGFMGQLKWLSSAEKWAATVAPMVERAVRDKAPVGRGAQAGRLRDSIKAKVDIVGNSAVIRVESNVPYSKFVVDGTPPHIIAVRSAGALHWVDQGGEQFAMSVDHPGTKPNKFAEKAIRPLIPLMQRRMADVIIESVREG